MLALCVALGCRLFRAAPVIRHALWLVVFIRLIVPPVFSLGLKLPAVRFDWLPTGHLAESAAESSGSVAAESDRTLGPQAESTEIAVRSGTMPEPIDDLARGSEQLFDNPPFAKSMVSSPPPFDGEPDITTAG